MSELMHGIPSRPGNPRFRDVNIRLDTDLPIHNKCKIKERLSGGLVSFFPAKAPTPAAICRRQQEARSVQCG